MKSIVKLIMLLSIVVINGCILENNELLNEEVETADQEEVQKELENHKKADESQEGSPSEDSIGEKFGSLPMETQIALLTPYYDERGEPQRISDNIFFIYYGIEDSFIFIQVHSGAGVGHPVYMIERRGDTFNPVDGVTNMAGGRYEITHPPEVSVSVEELMADYESKPDLYDASSANVSPDKFDLASFNELKAIAEETSDNAETE